MNNALSSLPEVHEIGQNPGRLPVSIIIPGFGAAAQLAACLESLARFAPAGCNVIVADDATPDDSLERVVRSFESRLSLEYVRRASNLGFVENCNEAIRAVLDEGTDVLLLNSDTEVTAGFLEEMWAVLHLHEKHGAVTPRSNNATIFSVPLSERIAPPEAYQLWQSIRRFLPRYQVMPTAVGFCMLIKNAVLRQLGMFDAAYSPGYNEENDFICRINRHGYSAVAANQAFVFHHESSSFGSRRTALEARNRQLLDQRYPEYSRKITEHLRSGVDPVDHFSILWRAHRPTILYDLSHLPASHSGTSDFALSLLLHLSPLLEPDYELRVGVSQAAREFFAHELTGYRFYDESRQPEARFDLVFKPSQIFTWPELYRMVRLGGRVAYTHLDIIAARCSYLSAPPTRMLFKAAAQLADRVITISDFSQEDFGAFYGVPASFTVIHLGTHERTQLAGKSGGYVLVVGNRFHHKAVHLAIDELRGIADIVALGGEERPIDGVRWLSSGSLSRWAVADLYDGASVVVYPSFYEGFGIPILDALARGIPVVALDTAVNRELRSLTQNPQLTLVGDHRDMRAAVSTLLSSSAPHTTSPLRQWSDVANDYKRTFDELLRTEVDIERLRRRWELLTTIDAIHPLC